MISNRYHFENLSWVVTTFVICITKNWFVRWGLMAIHSYLSNYLSPQLWCGTRCWKVFDVCYNSAKKIFHQGQSVMLRQCEGIQVASGLSMFVVSLNVSIQRDFFYFLFFLCLRFHLKLHPIYSQLMSLTGKKEK